LPALSAREEALIWFPGMQTVAVSVGEAGKSSPILAVLNFALIAGASAINGKTQFI